MKSVGIPLVLTFRLDPISQARLDAWRTAHFPPDRNRLKAHLTIYHQLPGQQQAEIQEQLAAYAGERKAIPVRFETLLTRHGFVGVRVASEELMLRKEELDSLFANRLRAQDRQPYRPHVTVANLGSPRDAARAYAQLEQDFRPWDGNLLGLDLFHYRGGLWEGIETYDFGAP